MCQHLKTLISESQEYVSIAEVPLLDTYSNTHIYLGPNENGRWYVDDILDMCSNLSGL